MAQETGHGWKGEEGKNPYEVVYVNSHLLRNAITTLRREQEDLQEIAAHAEDGLVTAQLR